jgi:uncharacterized protein YdgA (DUF945 family)
MIKKSIITTAIIAVLGSGYIGASWHTGNMIEANIDNKIQQITKQVDNYQNLFNVVIEYSDYQKAIFSTQLHLTIKLVPKDTDLQLEQDKKQAEKKQEETTIFNDEITIHHGPFPMMALAEGKFTPQIAWINYAMPEKSAPELWKLAGNQSFITANMGISYHEYLTIKLTNKALKLTDSAFTSHFDANYFIHGGLDVSDGNVIIESNEDFSSIVAKANIDKFNYYDNPKEPIITLNKFNLLAEPRPEKKGVNYTINANKIAFLIDEYSASRLTLDHLKYQGSLNNKYQAPNAHVTIDKITFEPDINQFNDSSIMIEKLTIAEENTLSTANTIDGWLKVDAQSVLFGQQHLGNGSLDLSYQGINIAMILNNFDIDLYEADVNQQAPANIKLALNKLHWQNPAGDINANFFCNISGEWAELQQLMLGIDNIDSLKLKIDAPFNVLAYYLAQIKTPNANEVTQEQLTNAFATLKTNAKKLFGKSKMFTFNKDQNEGYYSDIKYTKGDQNVTVNGHLLDKRDFFENFL